MLSSLNVTLAELWQMLLTHLWLSGLALLAAVAIAVPAAALFARRQRAAEAVLQFTNILQTIPSLALLGLLIPFVGIGSPPVLIALTLYALLPIFQNTYLGLTQIDQSIQDAYTAFGLSRWQSLWRIELPMALPAMISGIRTAAVLIVGTATLAALIGAGGLGNLILLGIDRNNMTMTFTGALLSALLAVGVSGIIGLLQKSRRKLAIILALAVGLGALGLSQISFRPATKNVVIAGKMGSEPDILINMYKLLIERENSNVKVTVKPNFGKTTFLFSALNSGEIDIYPEFTGTVLEALVQVPTGQKNRHLSPDETYQQGKQLLAEQYQLEFLPPMSYQNTYALAVKESYGASHQLNTISDLKQVAPDIRAGFSLEFIDRADGYKGMQAAGITLKHIVSLEPALRYTALLNDKIDLVEAFSTDAELKQYQLRLLKDDISLFPAYQGAPLMKAEFAEKNPQIVTALNRLAGKISEEEMSEMNYRVKVQGESAENVARDYLEKNGLLGK
ncbi:ABC transporter permease/substrate-binding protein [Neisseria sp. DTU_2021_1001991_1_SI_NGA_ILE_055]|uniref:ABC transporter permease/substrate-binding protein n=1 Tax=Neisseria sp. DTU_2021_1001991_1_SI_NGA_ILE_055 TaxID=3077590 RepID=UPI0028E39902|nr:ABC transporter permease/substrate-binding protein [Neisseria sp. DTU_2021_1001991_1_SI_NGA_ILE_055]WNS84155.1 ABC transporter permease/substrate-binding protein [Neisseria sp. DTU_2021_1001991_1_SI_NGA_ILE_055]